MKLADALAQETSQPGPKCGVHDALQALSPEDQETLMAALEKRDALGRYVVTGAAISRALATIGHKMASGTVNRHRKRGCGCD